MLLYHMITTVWLAIISVFDIKSRRVSVWLLVIGGVIALPAIRWCCIAREYLDLLKGMLPGLLFLAVAFFTRKAGYGDGVVLLILGMVTKGKVAVLFGVSLFLISIFSIVLLTFHKVNRNTKMPYLPFLAAAWLLAMNL